MQRGGVQIPEIKAGFTKFRACLFAGLNKSFISSQVSHCLIKFILRRDKPIHTFTSLSSLSQRHACCTLLSVFNGYPVFTGGMTLSSSSGLFISLIHTHTNTIAS